MFSLPLAADWQDSFEADGGAKLHVIETAMDDYIEIPDEGGLFKTGGLNPEKVPLPVIVRESCRGEILLSIGVTVFCMFAGWYRLAPEIMASTQRFAGIVVMFFVLPLLFPASILWRCLQIRRDPSAPVLVISSTSISHLTNRRAVVRLDWRDVETVQFATNNNEISVVRLRMRNAPRAENSEREAVANNWEGSTIEIPIGGVDINNERLGRIIVALVERNGGRRTYPSW